MNCREQRSPSEQIKNITCLSDGYNCTISWQWPNGIEYVYIYRAEEGESIDIECIAMDKLTLYTRNEYMEYGGFHGRGSGIGRFTYAIYPVVREDGEILAIKQNEGHNRITVSTGKIHIVCTIRERLQLFSGRKIVKMSVSTDFKVSKDLLCYVKKRGAIPCSIDDGVVFPFIQDFPAGNSILPEVEVKKDEYIRIFLVNSKVNGELYELIFR